MIRAHTVWLWGEVRRRGGQFGLALLATVVAAIFSLVLPWRAQGLFDDIFPSGDIGRVARELGILFTIVAFAMAASVMRRYLMERFCLGVVTDLRRAMFAHIVSVSPRHLQKADGGKITSAFTNDLNVFHQSIRILFAVVAPSLFFAAIYVTAMFWYSWALSLMLVVVIVPMIFVTNIFGHRIHATSHQAQRRLAELQSELGEALAGSKEIKLFEMEPRIAQRFEEFNQYALQAGLKREKLFAAHPFTVSLFVAAGVAVAAIISVVMLEKGLITSGNLAAFVICLGLAYPPMQETSHSFGGMVQLFSVMDRVRALFDMPPERSPAETGENRPTSARIEMSEVSFSYDGENRALQGLTLDIAPGERIAVVGPSGAGKSTLLELLPRFHDPEAGQIRIGGVDIASMPLPVLRSQIGLVLQVPFLFRGTLHENLTAGAQGVTRERVMEVAHQARVDEFAARLPEGYETIIEPGGGNLSVGQRQRIAIARVLLKDPPILLLDEPTSALDSESERLVGDAIRHASTARTTVIVAHRLSTVRDVDRIVVLRAGRIVEQGSHDALIAQGGLYAQLYRQSTLLEQP